MCYTLQASIFSFVVNLTSSALLYAWYNRAIAVAFAFVGLMQLYDVVFWLNQQRNALNFWTTKLAMISNHLQPVVLALAIVYAERKPLQPASSWLLAVYCIAAVLYSTYAWRNTDYTLASCARASGALFWQWNYLSSYWVYVSFVLLFLVTLCALFIQHFPRPINYVVAALTVLSILFARVSFKGQVTGRFWCWTAGFIPIILAVVYSRVQKKKE